MAKVAKTTSCDFGHFISGYSTTVSASAFQAEDVGSIPITRSNLLVLGDTVKWTASFPYYS